MSYKFFKELLEGKVHKHMDFQGMDISIEIPAGGKRTGTNKKTGEKWEHKIDDAYGYIKGTHSPDGEHLDCYVRKNPDKDADVYVMHQLTVDGTKFDEDKVMLGYGSAAEAKKAFKSFTFKPDVMFGGMTEFTLEHFRLAAYSASKSHAMLTDEETYEEFKMAGLLDKSIKSPLQIARKVSEDIELLRIKELAGLLQEGAADDAAVSYLKRMWNLDQRYIDQFVDKPEPPCTCSPEQLNLVGCNCDQDYWRYAQQVLAQRAKYGLTGPDSEPQIQEEDAEPAAQEEPFEPMAHLPDEDAAWQWLSDQTKDEDYRDNERLGYLDDMTSMAKYDQQYNDGCCGYADYPITIGGREAWIGLNYGH
jgi:hypothetical protein